MKQHSATAGGKVTASQIAHDLPNTPGQPLDAATLAFMEPRFGHDFSQVRVHTDAQATDSAKAIRARAYTAGRDVFFGDGQFSPGSAERSKLLAHELSHVVQQCNGAPAVQRAPERDGDDEPVVKGPRPIGLPPPVGDLCGGRPCLTDEDLDPASLLRTLPTTQAELNEEAARLGEKQGKRRKFWNRLNAIEDRPIADAFIHSDAVRKKLADLDLVFATHYRDPSVDLLERPVLGNPEARKIYYHAYYAVMNELEEESYFHKLILGICEHTNPCKPIIDQQRANVASGMDPEEAVKQSLIRLGVETGIALLAPGQPDDLVTEGPRIPVGLPVAHPEFETGNLDPAAAGTEPAPEPPMQMTAKPPKPPSTGAEPAQLKPGNLDPEAAGTEPAPEPPVQKTAPKGTSKSSAVGKGAKASQAWPRTNTSAGRLPRFSGRGQRFVTDALQQAGFKEVNPNEWVHPDGSYVRIDPPHDPGGAHRSHNEPHYHKQWREPVTKVLYNLDDAGYINPDRGQTHIIGR